ncbi:MAG: cyanophycin synthetase [Gammaproteobacteria bacterium]|nr:cyanophycin synthetase [Gammaproteobacteria bacterium]
MRKLKAALYRSDRYMHGCTSYNTLEVRKGCRSKAQARAVFAANHVPHARGMVFLLPRKVRGFVKAHGFPVVVKPNVSGYSRGSYFPIGSFPELWRGILLAKAWWPTTVIEQYLAGANYRVLATGDRLVSVIRRYPPFVTGNGKDSIDALIDAENRIRARMKLHPVIFPISKSKLVTAHLKRRNLTLDSVPAKDERVELFHRVALAPGGIVETIDQQTIAADNAALFKDVVRMFNANLLGIDVIFEHGIEVSHRQQKCIFIEVNSRPYAKMHHFPRYGKVEDLSAAYAELDRLDIPDKDIF